MVKKILTITMIAVMMIVTLADCGSKMVSTSSKVIAIEPIKVGVLLNSFDDLYISEVRRNLEDIQKENEGKVEFSFFDSKNDQSIQNEILDTLLKNKSVNLLLVNLVDRNAAQEVIDRIKQINIPVIIFSREPNTLNPIKSYNKAIYVGTNAEQSGVFEGEIIINLWNEDNAYIDRNKDNILQYIMLKGPRGDVEASKRTKYSILTIENAGIQTEELSEKNADWDKELARNAMNTLLLTYINKVDAIISNNDAMAIGAIEALQAMGYNLGDKEKTIAVVGIDAIPEATDLIKKGFMTGTVIQDARGMAEALYICGMNLVSGRNSIDGTKYEFDDTGVAIRIHYKEYPDNYKG